MKYQLMYNNAAGKHWVRTWVEEELEDWEQSGYRTQDGYYTEWGLYNSKEELEKAVVDLRGPTVFCVFEDRSDWEAFISEENKLSGNWKGSKYGYYSLAGEYNDREAAEKHLKFFYAEES